VAYPLTTELEWGAVTVFAKRERPGSHPQKPTGPFPRRSHRAREASLAQYGFMCTRHLRAKTTDAKPMTRAAAFQYRRATRLGDVRPAKAGVHFQRRALGSLGSGWPGAAALRPPFIRSDTPVSCRNDSQRRRRSFPRRPPTVPPSPPASKPSKPIRTSDSLAGPGG